MSLSSDAQIFLIGLWTEADDQGIFEWKPITLRARLRPSRDGDVTILLSELTDANCIASYEIDGRKYGAIRNFRKFQKPKSPNSTYPIPDGLRKYVHLTNVISETKEVNESQFPQNGEKSLLVEEGGGKKDEIKKESAQTPEQKKPPSSEAKDLADEIWRAAGKNPDATRAVGKIDDITFCQSLISGGFTADQIADGARAIIGRSPEIKSLWGLLRVALPEELSGIKNGPPEPKFDKWDGRLPLIDKGVWLDTWSSNMTPKHVLDRYESAKLRLEGAA